MICLREVIPPFQVQHKELSNVNIAIEITKYMHNHYNQDITLDDAAKALFISTRQAQRIFKQFFNSSFTKMMNYYRMNYAKNYLMTTDYSVEKIAELVGLSSPQLLYNLFRTYEAQSIGEYRKKWSLGKPQQ